jgi:hypothetical protein
MSNFLSNLELKAKKWDKEEATIGSSKFSKQHNKKKKKKRKASQFIDEESRHVSRRVADKELIKSERQLEEEAKVIDYSTFFTKTGDSITRKRAIGTLNAYSHDNRCRRSQRKTKLRRIEADHSSGYSFNSDSSDTEIDRNINCDDDDDDEEEEDDDEKELEEDVGEDIEEENIEEDKDDEEEELKEEVTEQDDDNIENDREDDVEDGTYNTYLTSIVDEDDRVQRNNQGNRGEDVISSTSEMNQYGIHQCQVYQPMYYYPPFYPMPHQQYFSNGIGHSRINENKWLSKYHTLAAKVESNGGYMTQGKIGFELYDWLNEQRRYQRNGKLSREKIEMLKRINIL